MSWMANARTSSFIVRALVGIRNGLMLRSVGSNNMFLPVLFLRQEWHVVCQRVRKVHQFLIRGILVFGGFWAFMFLFSALFILEVLALVVYTQLCTRLGSLWCASCWTRPLGVFRWEHHLRDFWRANVAAHNTATHSSFCFFRRWGRFQVWKAKPDRWIAPHPAVRTLFDCCRWTSRVTPPISRTPLWPASWLPAVDKGVRGSKSVDVQRVWEVYDERLQFIGCFATG